ncbi:MAG: hypothetical protein IJK24_02365 [Oscillospiraceae bacterium]|nr:hypothetical protein [Oscillospiraceae bacterium]
MTVPVQFLSKILGLRKRCIRLLCSKGHLIDKDKPAYEKVEKTGFGKYDVSFRDTAKLEELMPTRGMLFKVGYEPPENCDTFFSYLRRFFRNYYKRLWLIFFAVLICLGSLSIDFINNDYSTNGYLPIYLFMVNTLFSATIVIYLSVVDTYSYRIDEMNLAFDEQNYQIHCYRYYKWVSVPFRFHKGVDSRTETEEQTGDGRKLAVAIWTLFLLIWISITILSTLFICKRTRILNGGISGIITIILYFVSMLLQSQSYYSCLLSICFFQKLTGFTNRDEVRRYSHNEEHPSQTSGLIQLLNYVNVSSTIFLTMSSLYLIAYAIIIHLRQPLPREPIVFATDGFMFAMFLALLVFSVVSTVVVYFGPKLMLKRMLGIWLEEQRNKLEKQYLQEHDEQKRIEISNRINQLKYEKNNYDGNLVKVIVAILEILSPILTYIATRWLQ